MYETQKDKTLMNTSVIKAQNLANKICLAIQAQIVSNLAR